MKIVDSVAKAISEWQNGDSESAMLHACNAVNGTATKAYKNIEGDRVKFTTLLRDNYSILGPIGMPGVDLEKTRFGVDLKKHHPKINEFDLADLIYKIHRCSHGHGDELLKGFELIPDAAGSNETTHFSLNFVDGTVSLSDRIIFGMLGVVVFSPANAHQKSDYGYFLSYGGIEFPINDWWGRANAFLEFANSVRTSVVNIYEYKSNDPAPARTAGEMYLKFLGGPTLED